MKKLFLLGLSAIVLSGCIFSRPVYVLTESESFYFIPAGTPFKARLVKNGKLEEVRRTQDSWAVDAGYLVKLQEEVNANVLKLNR